MKSNPLTVGERILVHLSSHNHQRNDYVAPEETTQIGMGKVLGITRAHAAVELRKLEASGLVECHLRHVNGKRTKLRSYHLTATGVLEAPLIKDRIKDQGPIEQFICLPASKNLKAHSFLQELHQQRLKIDDLEARYRAEIASWRFIHDYSTQCSPGANHGGLSMECPNCGHEMRYHECFWRKCNNCGAAKNEKTGKVELEED